MRVSRPFRSRRRPAPRAARGVVLIEVLVSLLIFAFGVLGLVGLQATMTQAQTAARARADAASLASELIGLMWSDLPNVRNYATDTGCVDGTPCGDWKNKVAVELPGGSSPTVTVTTAVAATATTSAVSDVTISLSWTLPGGGGSHSYTTRATLSGAL